MKLFRVIRHQVLYSFSHHMGCSMLRKRYDSFLILRDQAIVEPVRFVLSLMLSLLLINTGFTGPINVSAQDAVTDDAPVVWRETIEWTMQPFENPTVSIQSSKNNPIMDNKGRIEVLLLGGTLPLVDINIGFYSAVKNISGQWSTSNYMTSVRTDVSGLATQVVEPGNYALTINSFDREIGTFGVPVLKDGNSPYVQAIPVSIEQGEVVAVLIRLAKLVIGVTSEDGTRSLPNKNVYVYPQAKDIAGNPIPQAGFGDRARSTTVEGTCVWHIGAGEYSIRVANLQGEDNYIFDVRIFSGEEKQIIIKPGFVSPEQLMKKFPLSRLVNQWGKINVDRVRLRASASASSREISLFNKDVKVWVYAEVTNEDYNWYYIKIQDSISTDGEIYYGFMITDFIDLL